MINSLEDDIEQKIDEAIRNNAASLSLYGHNKTRPLPKTLLNIPCLEHLSIANNYADMPAWLADISTLKSLEIEETGSVSDVLPHLWKLRHLQKLKLAYLNDDLTTLPLSMAKLEILEELDLDGADFENFPTVIASLKSLQSFSHHFCYCPLQEVFEALSALPRLKKLRLTHSTDNAEGEFLPEAFCRLHAIEELHFNEWYALRELPECIDGMLNLRVLNLSNDDFQVVDIACIRELPNSLGNLCNLEELDVYALQDLKQLPSSFSRLSRLKRLDTMCSGIEELQLMPEQWKNLEELRMHGPLPDFQQCANLKKFSWFKNDVSIDGEGIPHGNKGIISLPLSPLHKLESLSIMGGALDSTAFLASLTNLRNLHLSCDFENFPIGFEKVNNLEEVSIWGAISLTSLPEYLGHMPSLKELRLTGCGVKELPISVRERKDIYIDVRNCPMQWPE